jgi:hypothetical protein
MCTFHNPAITGVLPEVSCTIRSADSFYAHDARHKSWCAANATVASAIAPTAAQISPVEAANARRESVISKVAPGDTNTQRACTNGANAAQPQQR